MKRIAKFHKVSRERFLKDWKDKFPETSEKEILRTEVIDPGQRRIGRCNHILFLYIVKISIIHRYIPP